MFSGYYRLVMAIHLWGVLSALWPQPAPGQVSQAAFEKFRLSAGSCAAEGYPMTIQFGAFVGSDGKNIVVPSGHYLNSKGLGM
jgi:hypothetical protein